MTPYPSRLAARILAEVALVNPVALVLIATLLGYPPCSVCGFVIQHCRCRAAEVKS